MGKDARVFIIPCENGYYRFKLEIVLKKINKTKYSLAKHLNSEYKVINRYARGNLSRFDAAVVAKICDYCDCSLDEILEYVPNEKTKKKITKE